MAKAQFHRHQKVWVEAVGSWAVIERIIPIWVKGFDEPTRITYDVGLGREFRADELRADTTAGSTETESDGAAWRVLRARNKWQAPEDCGHHPLPGTFPVVVTNAADWGGWRVPGAEYDRDPHKIEHQARLISAAPKLLQLANDLVELASEGADDLPPAVLHLARQAAALVQQVADAQIAPAGHAPVQAAG